MLKELKVKDVMTKDVITVPPQEDVIFAFEKLMKHRISSLPVMDGGVLAGIVTATDLGHNLILDKYELGTTVEQVMIKDVVCVSPEDDLVTAVRKMNQYGKEEGIINQLMVIEDHQIRGIISDGDIIRVLGL
ncbi:MAG TPA: CBS domain-containing protein [Methanobacteriaceae archaeon]|nr:CBS domain-containing protein [Euryarchaeota archaeon]HNR26635.1 CBS domain-containing protein [Methanobacteriaceae archaeon]HNS25539.1 CBS domain-containing protein [Methanobacteriaceae archaeon]